MKLPRRREDKPAIQYRRVRCEICGGHKKMLDGATGKWRPCTECGGTGRKYERR